jgi:formylmethanofuran dehydrogenase subunit C
MKVELELVSTNNYPVDVAALHPTLVLSLSQKEINQLPIKVAGRKSTLGEHFKVKRTDASGDELILSGDTFWITQAGYRMNSGRLAIHGDAGSFTGAKMSGGELEVFGNTGNCLGTSMQGGTMRVRGNCGDWCGAALPGQPIGMEDGLIVVDGNVGVEAGAGMRRGLLVIGGASGNFTGTRMLAGTILCLGQLGSGAGLEMKRGSLVAASSQKLLPGFNHAGEADLEWLRITMSWLLKAGYPVPTAWNQQLPKRFTGDHLLLGKGEILVYEFFE